MPAQELTAEVNGPVSHGIERVNHPTAALRTTGVLALIFLCAHPLFAQQGSIQGITINSVTHEPIAGVHVSLLAATSSSVTATYGAISDRDGRFSIATIRPGTYLLLPERTGFLAAGAKRSMIPFAPVTIRAGQQLTDFKVELTPRAILAGRVVDDHGDPVQGVSVNTTSVDEKEQPNFMLRQGTLPTDDRGEFRIATVPGRYYLQSMGVGSGNNNEKPEQRDGVPIAPLRSTYYPSSIAKSGATVVEAVAGKEIGGLEIRLSRQVGTSISGIVRGAPDLSMRPNVMVQFGTTPENIRSVRSVPTDEEGRFTFRDAQPGTYRLYAVWHGKPPMISPPAEFRLGDTDLANIELTVAPAGEVTGVVQVEGDPPGVDPPKRTVRLESMNGFSGLQPSGGATDSKGAFTVNGLAPSRYRVRVTPLPDNGYVKKVLVGDTESPDDTLDMSAASRSGRIKVVVARDGAQITGHVLDPDGARNPLSVVLMSPVPIAKEFNPEIVAQTQPDGTYSFKSLRPGKYRIVAIDPLRGFGNSPSDMSKQLEKGEEIELQPGARLQRDVRMLPKEDADAKPRQ
ncbi:MAG TPA: carboxypeptidase regulatory-like domain-containing protein [Candidatus Acidoferrum sp.]|nr:carboxypeptidase regulatory-like domain-containing protein [Candidatus Acidoferrum sp.]